MKTQILEKSYSVSEETKRVLDCKMLNEQLYSVLFDIIEKFQPAEAETIMDKEIFPCYSLINDYLNKCLGASVNLNFGDLKNANSHNVLI